eukprot:SAG11_NODE_10357_length_837_cov_1.306233_1_plen_46_part_10
MPLLKDDDFLLQAVKECTAGQPRLRSGSLQVQYSSEKPWRGTRDNP